MTPPHLTRLHPADLGPPAVERLLADAQRLDHLSDRLPRRQHRTASRSFITICSADCLVRFIESLHDPTGVHRDSHSTWTRTWRGGKSGASTLSAKGGLGIMLSRILSEPPPAYRAVEPVWKHSSQYC